MTEPNVTPQEFKYLKEQVTARMIQILIEEQGYSLEEAVDHVYTSPIYEKLSDASTGLFFQSPRYIMSYLEHKENQEAKYWLEPQVELAKNTGIPEHELNKIKKIVEKNADRFKEQYREHIGKRIDD